MEVVKKAFWQSKIIISGLLMLIGGFFQAKTGWYVTQDVMETTAQSLWEALNAQTIAGALTALAGLYLMVSRSLLRMEQIEKVWWKSGIFITGLLSFIAQIVYYQTGIELPDNLRDSLADQLIFLLNNGEIIPFFMQALPILVAIWRNYATTSEVAPVTPMRPVLSLYEHRTAA